MKENQDTGVWGGFSEDERKSLKRKYARARRAS
jgi:WhiB family redox-sensing transcriptional regulator